MYHICVGGSIASGVKEKLGLKRQVCAVKNCRNIGKKDMKNNDTMAEIEVNPETYEVKS